MHGPRKRSCPVLFTHRLDRLGRRSPGIFHGQLSHLTVRCTLGMKPEPPFKTADEKFRLPCEHDAEVTECQALLDTTALPVPKRSPPQQKVGVVCFHVCMRIYRNVERIWAPSVAQSRSGLDALLVGWLAQSGQKLAHPPACSFH